MDLRKQILEALRRTGKTRAKVIESAGIPKNSGYLYLRGQREISPDKVGKLLEAAGCRVTLPRWAEGRG